jgi:hypothetical protein
LLFKQQQQKEYNVQHKKSHSKIVY